MRALGNMKRGTLILCFLVQACLVLIVAGIIGNGAIEGRLLDPGKLTEEIDWRQIGPIALLSFQSAGQIVASRALKLNEISTVVLTSMLHDLAADPRLTVGWRQNDKRNMRFGAFAAVVVGAVAGGFIAVKTGKMQSTLWLVGGLKLGIAAAWVVWPAVERDLEAGG